MMTTPATLPLHPPASLPPVAGPLREAEPLPPAPTPEEAAAARAAMAAVLRRRLNLANDLDGEIALLIDQAVSRIVAQLAAAPTDYQLWVLPRLLEGMRTVLDALAGTAAARVNDALRQSWELGALVVDAPIDAAAAAAAAAAPPLPGAIVANAVQQTLQPVAALGLPDVRQLRALQNVTTEYIRGATASAVNQINRQLGQVVLGAQTPFEATRAVAALLPDRTASQVRGIVNLGLGQAFNSASFARLQAQALRDPNLMKQWRRSGKRRSRHNHDASDGQVVAVAEPFVLMAGNGKGTVKLMHPCDPAAPVGETINCGCVCLAWKKGWKMRTPAAKPFTTQELADRAGPRKRPPAKPAPAQTPQARALAAFPKGTHVDVTGQTVKVDAALLPPTLGGDARLVKQGRDLASYWATQAIKKPTEVWQQERIDLASGEVVRTRRMLKRFEVGGTAWLGVVDLRFDGAAWVGTQGVRLRPAGGGVEAVMAGLRAGVRAWPRR